MFKRKNIDKVAPEGFPSEDKQINLALGIERKYLLLELSYLFGILLAVLLVYDLTYYITFKSASLTSQWLVSILILHIMSCSFGVVSFIYANESGDFKIIRIAGLSIGFNSLVMVTRSIVEYSYQNYKPQFFSQ